MLKYYHAKEYSSAIRDRKNFAARRRGIVGGPPLQMWH
jgi:hypothetical protein